MAKSDTSKKWIEAGYELFAYEGPEGIQIEKLARMLGMNKSGFYHHFGDRDLFLEEIIQHHYRVIDQFCQEMSFLQHFDPDYLRLLIKYKTSAFIQMQFRRHMNIPTFKEAFNKVRIDTEKVLLPLWENYMKIHDHTVALELWNILRDMFFMRLTTKNLSMEFLQKLVGDYKEIIKSVGHMKRSSP